MESTIEQWRKLGDVTDDWAKRMKKQIQESYQYIRTDYKVHVKDMSRVADHCFSWSLSEPRDNFFRAIYQDHEKHPHDMQCSRCELFKNVLDEMQSTSEDILQKRNANMQAHPMQVNQELLYEAEATEHKMSKAIVDIENLRNHQLRVMKSDQHRRMLIDRLEEGDAFLTIDFAMRLLKYYHRERQSQFFGQEGNSWSITDAESKLGDTIVHHHFVHILKENSQV